MLKIQIGIGCIIFGMVLIVSRLGQILNELEKSNKKESQVD